MTAGTGPLAGIRVLDLSALAPGPFATTLLGDLGADVITLEAPPAARPGSGVGDLGMTAGTSMTDSGDGLDVVEQREW